MAGMPCETRQSVLRQIKSRLPNSKIEKALHPYMKLPLGPECLFQWPDSEEFSVEFQRLLGAAQEGGEVLAAGRRRDHSGGGMLGREVRHGSALGGHP